MVWIGWAGSNGSQGFGAYSKRMIRSAVAAEGGRGMQSRGMVGSESDWGGSSGEEMAGL